MSERDGKPPSPGARPDHEIVAEHELIRRAGFDLAHYLGLSEHEQRQVLKMAERLVDAARRTEPDA